MILHIVRNPVSYDSRVLKETGSILDRYPEETLIVAGFHEGGFAQSELIGRRHIKRHQLYTRGMPKDVVSQSVKFLEWRASLIRSYCQLPLKVIHCHDLAPLPVAVRLKNITGAKLIYDAHELETEMKGLSGIRKRLLKSLERRYIRYVDQMITVSPSIRKWYAHRYPSLSISIVRNIPEKSSSPAGLAKLRNSLGVPDDSLLFLYLGGLSEGRGIRTILEGFSNKNVTHHVLFMGSGPLLDLVNEYSANCNRVHYREPVPPSEVITYANGADIGLCMYEDTCLNHRYCLPNKLFESILAGMPVLASDLPDQADVVRQHKAGWVISPSVLELTNFLLQIDTAAVRDLRIGLSERTSNLSWGSEADVLLQLYSGLLR